MVQSNIQYIEKELSGKTPQQSPTFYITYGPPASGKGGIMKKVLEKDNVHPDSLINVVVDDIVTSTPGYTEERDRLLLEGATKKQMQDLYWGNRNSADSISTALLNTALLDRFNISWETTGKTIGWTVREIKRIQRQNYDTVVVYPWVPVYSKINGKPGFRSAEELKKICDGLPEDTGLLDRAQWREQCRGQEAAPSEQIINDAEFAQKNIIRLLNIVDKIYLYDNSGGFGEDRLIFSIENVYEWTPDDDPHTGVIDADNKIWAGPGHSYLVHCFINCDKDIRIYQNKGMERELFEVLNKFCCEHIFVEEIIV